MTYATNLNDIMLQVLGEEVDYSKEQLVDALVKCYHEFFVRKIRSEADGIVRKKTYEKCQWCGKETKLEMHHIIPVRSGGDNSDDNLVFLCHECHKTTMNKKYYETHNI